MARKPDAPCSGCGKHLWGGKSSLPVGERTCRSCRKTRPKPAPSFKVTCAACGSCFIAQRISGHVRKTCSAECALVKQKHPPKLRECEICGKAYRRTYPKQRTCGRACGAVLHVRGRPPRQPRRPRPDTAKVCRWCSGSFSGPRRAYCSPECSALARRAADLVRYGKTLDDVDRCRRCSSTVAACRRICDACKALTARDAKRRKRRRERAQRRGVAHEPYTLVEIAGRDRMRCGLCRKRVAMKQVVPHPKAPTIDHILPIAAGGDDTRANVQLAHFECNWKKSDGGTQQLLLFG